MVYEQVIEIDNPETGETISLLRITIELDKPTRDGDTVLHLLTNLPNRVILKISDIYRNRWTVETAFQELGQMLNAEIDTLCYPARCCWLIALPDDVQHPERCESCVAHCSR